MTEQPIQLMDHITINNQSQFLEFFFSYKFIYSHEAAEEVDKMYAANCGF